jgi:UDP-glucose 4-epimerase
VESFARRNAHVTCCVLRLQPQVAPGMDSPITRLLRGRVVPTVLGFDPRVQLVDGDDAVAALQRAVEHPVPGAVNVAPDEVVPLSRALREVGRIALPIAAPLYGTLVRGVPAEVPRYMRFGRGVAVRRMHDELGFTPARGTIAALARAAA